VHAEWTKLRTTAGPAWLLLAAVAGTVALGAAISAAACTGCGADGTRLALSGVYLGQLPVVVLAVLIVSGEYSTGLIRTTVAAVPHRPAVLAAKALVVGGPVAVAGGVAAVASLVVTGTALTSPSLRAAAGTAAYLVLIAVLSLGVAAVLRDSGGAIGAVLGLLYLPPVLTQLVADPGLHRLLERLAPMSAGLAVQATTGPDGLPAGPWAGPAGLAVLAAWAGTALLAGTLLLRRRDT
jgi:ABC-2 type transport system permease protein